MAITATKKQKLYIEHTNFGYFRKAKLGGVNLTENELLKIMGIKEPKRNNFRRYVYDFLANKEYEIDVYESDVS